MSGINQTKLNAFRAFVPQGPGVGVLDSAEKAKPIDNDVSVIRFFEATNNGAGARGFLNATPSPVADPTKIAKVIEATPQQLEAMKGDAAKFAAHLDAAAAARADYLRPTFGQLQGAPTRFKFNTIVGTRVTQFVDEATKLANELFPSGAKRDEALRAVNRHGRELMNRKVDFDQFEINGYASFGHDAAFVHVYEKRLAALNAVDARLLTPDQKASVERQKKQIQGQLDDIFRHKYVYNNSSMHELNAEQSMGLVAIAKGSRRRISEKPASANTIVPQFETLTVQDGGQTKAIYFDATAKKHYFDGTAQEVPAALLANVQRQDVAADDVTFRRAVSGEPLRKNFRFDWDGDGYVNRNVIDWVPWAGHCNDKAALEAAGVVVPEAHKGVYEYNSASGQVTHFNRDLLNEALLSFSELGSAMGTKNLGTQATKDIGKVEFASARDDDRPDKLVLSNGREIPFRTRPNKFDIQEIKTGGKTYTADEAFSEYIVAGDRMSATKNPLFKNTVEGDYVQLGLGAATIKARAEIELFDLASGYPEKVSRDITIDLANPPAEPILVDSIMQDPSKREMYKVSLDLKKKEWVAELVRYQEKAGGGYEEVKVPGQVIRNPFDPAQLAAKRETSLDNPATFLPFVEGAMKTGTNATAETADGSGVWNGRINSLERALDKREGDWERTRLGVDARYGSNDGMYLTKLDKEGKPEFHVPLEMTADFWWRQQITFAGEKDGLVNVTARDRGLVSIEGGAIKTDTVDSMLEVLHSAFANRHYTIVHEGQRYFFADEASWKQATQQLDQLRGAVFSGGVDPGPGPGPVGTAKLVEDAGSVARKTRKQYEVTAEADGELRIKLDTKSGDADLFVKRGGAATEADHTLKSDKGDLQTDALVVPVKKGEKIGIAVFGYKASDFALEVVGPKVGVAPGPVDAPVAFNASGNVKKNEERRFEIPVTKDGPIDVTLGGNGDADLYVRLNAQPTLSEYDARPYLESSSESAKIEAKKGDKLFVMVRGYGDSADFNLAVKSQG
jgi:hypothetical protein